MQAYEALGEEPYPCRAEEPIPGSNFRMESTLSMEFFLKTRKV